MKSNKEELKLLSKKIRNYKRSLKRFGGNYCEFGEPEVVQSDLYYMRRVARKRSIAQALTNRKFTPDQIRVLSEVGMTRFLNDIGIERNLRPCTDRLSGSDIAELMPSIELKHAG